MHGLSLHQTEYLVRDRLGRAIDATDYLSMGGQIIDATPVPAPRQRNTDGEKAAIRAGQKLESWKDKPASLRHNNRDARWTVKVSKAKPKESGEPQIDIAIPVFGYKNHVSVDRRHSVIRRQRLQAHRSMTLRGCARV
jgi:hypothetical protein